MEGRGVIGGEKAHLPRNRNEFWFVLGSPDKGPNQVEKLEALRAASRDHRDSKTDFDLMEAQLPEKRKNFENEKQRLELAQKAKIQAYNQIRAARKQLANDVPRPPDATAAPPQLDQTSSTIHQIAANGSLTLRDVRLAEKVGESEGHYLLKLQVMKSDGTPLQREVAGPTERMGNENS
mmetsp:Transcript_32727/g.51056  ORF Transcript_32727/g.51056 Transcript_32727/m.51056 type:complete len:179 (+) Transcript_32727:1945-2481(+)|eukprot:CAMPEP_0184326046 /NCGR_PEP_ID=MMETSP1049-20130417/142355_1 /TAXON_ID=77928 /ORGANISM="Proteomonas sulcata, Strain CCMP704" /LENGTH=178 /DNA_ID=CAMNT_0026648215 /DNA_START=798 /DNA_END=1334 /DNA_ORIENTATION=-